ncbi:MAG TPA: sodium-dependent transporter [Lacunisphaera sp.]|jgi:SNF family Na+-dependent transporter|nr:sodium-dependent transporter [Lacunisphaera sp.]
MPEPKEAWSSRLGVILAVAGSAVGLGNFLRFPGLAAQYGGAAFMIAYFVALLLLGIPIGWTEWTMGRQGGLAGYHSSPGIFHAIVRHPLGKYLGLMGFIIPVVVYMYYVYIEAWCLGYALNAASGTFSHVGIDYGKFFADFTGAGANGVAIHFGLKDVGLFVVLVYIANFYFIYKGLSKGIEFVCKWGMPVLILIALIILGRVMTLGTPDPAKPDQNVLNGLGYMWNPHGIWNGFGQPGLGDPQLWLAAAGQIFFSLSVGFGAIITYASYLRKKDDVVLSGLTAASANEFCEVGLGGLITVPAAFVFLGAAGIAGQGTFGLGFKVLPFVFSKMPFGDFFATIFYVLLFIAAITSSLSMLQPGVAFFEEGLRLKRKAAMGALALLTGLGTMIVWWFSKDLKALDTIDFWIGTVGIFIQGMILVATYSWIIGIEEGWKETHAGAAMRIPGFYKPVLQFVSPLFLFLVFLMFIGANVLGWNFSFAAPQFHPTSYVADLVGPHPSNVARGTFLFTLAVIALIGWLVHIAGRNWSTGATGGNTR